MLLPGSLRYLRYSVSGQPLVVLLQRSCDPVLPYTKETRCSVARFTGQETRTSQVCEWKRSQSSSSCRASDYHRTCIYVVLGSPRGRGQWPSHALARGCGSMQPSVGRRAWNGGTESGPIVRLTGT